MTAMVAALARSWCESNDKSAPANAPILPVLAVAQIDQEYFKLLGFTPAPIPPLAFENAVAEKISAASQRSKIRDLHDPSEIAGLCHRILNSFAVWPASIEYAID
jgi:predicted nucleotidyltransferase component of viral defense system